MIDLHLHTTASDGILTPTQMVKKAKEIGLSAIAITDHDQVAGVEEGIEAGEKLGIEVVPGVELSAYWKEKDRKEFHLLGYCIDHRNKKLLKRLDFFQKERVRAAKKHLGLLAKVGYKIEWADVLKLAKGSVGKPHIIRACTDNPLNYDLFVKEFGQIPSINDFVQRYMKRGQPAHVEKAGFEPKEAIDLIHEVGGVAVLAHPCFDIPEGEAEIVKTLVVWGIDGLEAIAPYKTPPETKPKIEYFTKLAKDNNLIITGGSDYHGLDGVGAGMGLLKWGFSIPDKILESLEVFSQNS